MKMSTTFKELESPILKGAISQHLAKIYFALKNWECFEPTNESGRVDYIVFDGTNHKKVQVKTVNQHKQTGKFLISLTKKGKNNKKLKYTAEELDILVAYSPHHNAMIEIPGHLVHEKDSITFSSKSEGNYRGTSRFIEDFIVLKF